MCRRVKTIHANKQIDRTGTKVPCIHMWQLCMAGINCDVMQINALALEEGLTVQQVAAKEELRQAL